ncbi:MAG TPA: hypothetical protein VGD19_07825 [Allosphingosinicella sp.]
MRAILPLALLLASACQEAPEPGESRGSTTPRYERGQVEASPLESAIRPVRIGELGPNFAACSASGTTRRGAPGAGALAVRAAPYEAAGETDRLPAGASFFVCSRSLDQKWFGIVYDDGGTASERCAVSRPVPARRDYRGLCRSGWVASAFVKLSGRPA